MTKEERELYFLREQVEKLQGEVYESAKRLKRAEQRIVQVASWVVGFGSMAVMGAGGYLVFQRENDVWDWLGIVVLGVMGFLFAWEAIRDFERK